MKLTKVVSVAAVSLSLVSVAFAGGKECKKGSCDKGEKVVLAEGKECKKGSCDKGEKASKKEGVKVSTEGTKEAGKGCKGCDKKKGGAI